VDNSDTEFQRLLLFLLGGSRGGENRARIVYAIRSRPHNINQLAKLLGLDYRAIQHHITVLLKNSLIVSSEKRYGAIYMLHPWLDHHFAIF
jgi:predicted transcriptional regulator